MRCIYNYISKFLFQFGLVENLKNLAIESGFEICELYRSDELISGLLLFGKSIDTYTFCRKSHHYTYLECSSCFYEPKNREIATDVLNSICDSLNYDCIEKVSDELDLLGMADLVKTWPHLMSCAARKFSNLTISKETSGKIDVLDLYYILNSFGDIVQNITLSTDAFDKVRKKWNIRMKYSIIHCIVHYTTANLKTVNLHGFDMSVDNERIRPLILILNERNVEVKMF